MLPIDYLTIFHTAIDKIWLIFFFKWLVITRGNGAWYGLDISSISVTVQDPHHMQITSIIVQIFLNSKIVSGSPPLERLFYFSITCSIIIISDYRKV